MNLEIMKQITDKDLIVFLVAKGFDIKAVRRDMIRSRSLVYFEKSDTLEEAIIEFTNKSAVVNISDYIAADRRVTTMLCLQKTS